MSKLMIVNALLDRMRTLMNDPDYKKAVVAKDTAFTRRRKQSFIGIITMILSGIKCGLTRKIREVVEEGFVLQETISNQAFSKQRMLIQPEAIRKIFEVSVDFICEYDMTERYKGYRPLAIDGTMYNLPNTAELEAKYGTQKSSGVPQVQAKGSCLLDLASNLILDATFTPCKTSERVLAAQHIQFLYDRGLTDSLVIMDRGYPSFELIHDFQTKNLHYLMRSTDQFFKEVRAAEGNDSIITRKEGDRMVQIRVIKFQTKDGRAETLITNVYDTDFTCDDFKELYRRRWEIETSYDILKNTLEIEKFSGTSEIAILQDFYASMSLKNVALVAIWSQEEEIRKRNRERERKHDYKINVNAAVDAVRSDMIALIMEPSDRKRNRMFKALRNKLLSKVVPTRPNRSFGDPGKPRKPKHPGYRYPHNRKN